MLCINAFRFTYCYGTIYSKHVHAELKQTLKQYLQACDPAVNVRVKTSQLKKARTHKSVMIHADSVFVPHNLDL